MDIASFLSTVNGFKSLEPEELENLSRSVSVRTFAPGDYLLKRGEPGDHMQVLFEGRVRIPLVDPQGNERGVVQLGAGDLVGEMALLTGEPRSADVIAETDVHSVLIDRVTLEPLLRENPTLAQFLTEILGKRLMDRGGMQRVGKYLLLEKLGEGATGKVYEALHPGLNRVVAVKMLSHSLVYNAQFRDRFLDEARTVAGLSHPNIVQVFDTEAAYATYFIVMEKLSGTDLTHVLKTRKTLPADEAAAILRQMAAALAYAHSRGFAHRDIKPANCAIDDRLGVKLMDFGLARPILKDAEGKRSKTVEGTPQYIAPETALGQPSDGRVDIYALGVLAFEMLTGRLPFTSTKVMELLQAHVRTPPPDVRELRPDLPDNLVEFIHGTLIKKPDQRLTDWGRIQQLLAPPPSRPTEVWTDDALECVVRIRYSPSRANEVERAVEGLVNELGTREVEVSQALLTAVRPASGRD